MIPKDVSDANMDCVNLLTNHCEINLNMITKFEETYIGKELRSAQDKNMLYHFLMNSVSKVGKAKASKWNIQYIVNGIPSVNILLKVIIRGIHLDTNAKTTSIRTQLRSQFLSDICLFKFCYHIKNNFTVIC